MDRKSKNDFSSLGLNAWLVRQCDIMGIKSPTEIQKNCIPKILAGLDCIGCAKTGSGKTLTFALPILQKLCQDPFGIFALIIAPTRELAYQMSDQFVALGSIINLHVCVVTGGIEMVLQAQDLSNKPHVVIATPGRLADHLQSCNTFNLDRIQFLVLDEADKLLSGRFNDQLRIIFQCLPQKKQILLFSATLTDSIEEVKNITSKKVFVYSSDEETLTVDELNQYYVLCPSHAREGYLVETIHSFVSCNANPLIIIFTDSCRNCQLISMMLSECGIENVALHSVYSQKQRLVALAKFKSGSIRILIATDVASRGLDIPHVSLVVNYSIPSDVKDYVHRVGRTARAGRQGTAISLFSQFEISLLHAIENTIGTKLKEYPICGKQVANHLTQVKVTLREAEIKLDDTDFDERKLINKRKKLILEGRDPYWIDKRLNKFQKTKTKKKKELCSNNKLVNKSM